MNKSGFATYYHMKLLLIFRKYRERYFLHNKERLCFFQQPCQLTGTTDGSFLTPFRSHWIPEFCLHAYCQQNSRNPVQIKLTINIRYPLFDTWLIKKSCYLLILPGWQDFCHCIDMGCFFLCADYLFCCPDYELQDLPWSQICYSTKKRHRTPD